MSEQPEGVRPVDSAETLLRALDTVRGDFPSVMVSATRPKTDTRVQRGFSFVTTRTKRAALLFRARLSRPTE